MPETIDKKSILKCPYCGFSKKAGGKHLVEKEKITHKVRGKGKAIKEENDLATYKNKCKKCGFGKAQVIDMGVAYSDEDNLILLKCGKCCWAERVGKKTS